MSKKMISVLLAGFITVFSFNTIGLNVYADPPTTSTEDITAPTLNGISFSSTSVEAPGTVEVIIDASDDISGVRSANFAIRNINSNVEMIIGCSLDYFDATGTHVYSDGKLHGVLEFGQYAASGDYNILFISLTDNANNTTPFLYGRGFDQYDNYVTNYPDQVLPASYNNTKVTVVNTGRVPNVITSTNNASFVDQINSVTDDGTIVADFSNNSDVDSSVFTALSGTNKELTFTSQGVSWQFNGSDIVPANVKDIDLSVTVNPITNETVATQEQIKNLVGDDTSALVLHFADNGTLPGRATMRIKADYALRQYLGTTGLSVFYWDNTNNSLVPIAANVDVDANNDIIFEITHCSYYIVTGQSVSNSSYNPSGNETATSNNSYYVESTDRDEGGLEIALEDAAATGKQQTIYWDNDTTLSIDTMDFLKKNPNITLVMNYVYKGKAYKVVIPGSKAVVDPSIPWYGPLWLAGHYGSTISETAGTTSTGTYIVKKGDSLWLIARRYKTTVKELLLKNPEIKNSALIYVGQTIKY